MNHDALGKIGIDVGHDAASSTDGSAVRLVLVDRMAETGPCLALEPLPATMRSMSALPPQAEIDVRA
jgi:hypothetical protein